MSHENRNNRLTSRRELERLDSIRLFLNDGFARHSRLLVLRLDFNYQKDVPNNLDTVSRDRERLIRYLREPYNRQHKNAYIGLVWKLEYGKSRGYHLHTLIVLDGTQLQQDVTHATIIGEYWKQHITQGDGMYHSCNAEKEKYQHCGIGRIDRCDSQKRHYLLHDAASYLAEEDELMQKRILIESERMAAVGDIERASKIANSRCFGKTPLPARREDTPCRGRPRSRDDIRW